MTSFSWKEKHKNLSLSVENISHYLCGLDDALSPYCRGGVIVFFWQKRFKILRLVTISGQNQAYAQAALQYAYAPNMLTAQQLTAAGLSYLLSFKMCLGCLYSVVFRNIIARPKRPYPCPSLPSILGLTSPGFPAYAAAAGSNKFPETQFNLTLSGIWIHLFVDTSEFVCQVPLQQGKPTLNSSQQSKESSEKEVRIFLHFCQKKGDNYLWTLFISRARAI